MNAATLARIIFLLIVPVVSTQLHAQVQLGSVAVTLNQPRGVTLHNLRQRYRLDSVTTASGDNWLVVSARGASARVVGELSFSAGHLSLVSREWTPSDSTDPIAATTAIVDALETLEGSQSCSVHHSSRRQSQFELFEVHVLCGSHTVTIGVTKVRGSSHASVAEVWRALQH